MTYVKLGRLVFLLQSHPNLNICEKRTIIKTKVMNKA